MSESTEPSEPTDGESRRSNADDAPKASFFGRGFDTAIGATSRVVRATSEAAEFGERVARSTGAAALGRLAANAARSLTEPLAREGAAVRAQIEDDFPEAARDLSARVLPAVVDTIDPDTLIQSINLDEVLATVDMNRLLASIDIEAMLDRIDMAALLDKIDVDRIIDRVDIDKIVGRVDIDKIIDKVDIDRIIQRVDIAAVVGRVDVDQLVTRTELGSLIAKSTTGVATQALDGVRRQGVGLDNVIGRVVNRVMRRDPASLPLGPPLLVGATRGQLPAPDATEQDGVL